jgi:hypothetical protein
MPTSIPPRARAILASVLVTVIALAALYIWTVLHWSYSEGERAGYLQKLSRKGWLCKTWEGEILLSSMPGAIPERFAFTVRDESASCRRRWDSAYSSPTNSTSASRPPASARRATTSRKP